MAWKYLERGFWLPCMASMVDWCRRQGVPVKETKPPMVRQPNPPPTAKQLMKPYWNRENRRRTREMKKDLNG